MKCLSCTLARSLCLLYRSKVGFIRLFGGGAGLALSCGWVRKSDSTRPWL